MFKVIEDIKLADELYNAGLLWTDSYGEILPCRTCAVPYYVPSKYRKHGANPLCNYYILIEE